MSDTTTSYSISKRTSPDGKFYQWYVLDQGFPLILAEVPAASYDARIKQLREIHGGDSPAGGESQGSQSDTTTQPPQA